jgi:hypothetical protein
MLPIGAAVADVVDELLEFGDTLDVVGAGCRAGGPDDEEMIEGLQGSRRPVVVGAELAHGRQNFGRGGDAAQLGRVGVVQEFWGHR